MRRNASKVLLPNVTATGSNATTPVDVGSSDDGFVVQITGITSGGTYVLEGSVDEGTTWTDLTTALVTLPALAAATSPLTANGIWQWVQGARTFPGTVRLRCTHIDTGTPVGVIAWSDKRAA